jgi:hypothetical protein
LDHSNGSANGNGHGDLRALIAEQAEQIRQLRRQIDPYSADRVPIRDKDPLQPRSDVEQLWRDVLGPEDGPVEKSTGRPVTPTEDLPGEGFRARQDRTARGWLRWKTWAVLDSASKSALAVRSRFSEDYGKMPLFRVVLASPT